MTVPTHQTIAGVPFGVFKPVWYFVPKTCVLNVVMTQAEILAMRRDDDSDEAVWARKVAKQLDELRARHVNEFGKCELRCIPMIYDGAIA